MTGRARTGYAAIVLSCVLLVPLAAQARKAKSPFWARVAADGQVLHGNGVPFVLRPISNPTGVYQVFFDREVVGDCSFVATTTDGYAAVVGTELLATAGSINVYIFSIAGERIDLPFHIAAFCPRKVPRGD